MAETPARRVGLSSVLLSIAYLPPVEYFSLIRRNPGSAALDASENYCKQTYRNRCRILTANGMEDLRFPVIHDGAKKIKELKVDYSTPWVAKTETALDSAYYSSPFFEYYRDDLFALFDSKPETLWELDLSLLAFLCARIGLPVPPETSAGNVPEDDDYRNLIHPKKAPVETNAAYWQVFRERFGFVPNLSVVDLLFNEGPESICYL